MASVGDEVLNLEPMAFWKKVGIAQPGMFTVILCPASCLEASRMLRAINISLQVLMDQGKKCMYATTAARMLLVQKWRERGLQSPTFRGHSPPQS